MLFVLHNLYLFQTMRQLKQLLSVSEVYDYVEIVFDSLEGLTSLDNKIVSL